MAKPMEIDEALIAEAFEDWCEGTSAIELAQRVGIHKETLIRRFRDMGFMRGMNGNTIERKRNKRHVQPCWYCKRSVLTKDACSWAKDFVPVDGWDAEPAKLAASNGHCFQHIETYKIKSCPLFEMDEHSKKCFGKLYEIKCESKTVEQI